MAIIALCAAAVVLVYGCTALWLRYRYVRRFPLCGYVLPPELLERLEKRLQAEGKPVPRWVTEGRKRGMCRAGRSCR